LSIEHVSAHLTATIQASRIPWSGENRVFASLEEVAGRQFALNAIPLCNTDANAAGAIAAEFKSFVAIVRAGAWFVLASVLDSAPHGSFAFTDPANVPAIPEVADCDV